jgi:hypothetical protein
MRSNPDSTHVEEAVQYAITMNGGLHSHADVLRSFADVYDAFVVRLSDEALSHYFDFADVTYGRDLRLIAFARLEQEFRRRGLGGLTPRMRKMRNRAVGIAHAVAADRELPWRLAVAELRSRLGDRDGAKLNEIEIETFLNPKLSKQTIGQMACDIARTAARTGERKVLDDLLRRGWWRGNNMVPAFDAARLAAADGFVDVGKFDEATVILSDKSLEVPGDAVGRLANALLEADKMDAAVSVAETLWGPGQASRLADLPSFLAAKARQGKDALTEAKTTRRRNLPTEADRERLVHVAIATIGYTVSMKNRIAEYGKR